MTAKRPPGYSKAPPTMALFWLFYLTVAFGVVFMVAILGGLKAAATMAAVFVGLMYVLRRWGT